MNQQHISTFLAALGVFCIVGLASPIIRGAGPTPIRVVPTFMSGFQEVPSKLTGGHGIFRASIREDSISYRLTYSDLSSQATVAHIHFAQRGVNGEIIAFLCGGEGKPNCPPSGGAVSGTIKAGDILAVPKQGVTAGDFAGAVRAILSGDTYVNVHSTIFPEGEIRGQIKINEE